MANQPKPPTAETAYLAAAHTSMNLLLTISHTIEMQREEHDANVTGLQVFKLDYINTLLAEIARTIGVEGLR